MADTKMTEDERRSAIEAKLAWHKAETAKIAEERAPIDAMLDPLIRRERALDEELELFLEDVDAEVVGHCETCGKLLLSGDRGSNPYRDEFDMYFCDEDSMTYADLKRHWEEPGQVGDAEEDEEDRKAALEMVETHVANGGSLDDRITYVL